MTALNQHHILKRKSRKSCESTTKSCFKKKGSFWDQVFFLKWIQQIQLKKIPARLIISVERGKSPTTLTGINPNKYRLKAPSPPPAATIIQFRIIHQSKKN